MGSPGVDSDEVAELRASGRRTNRRRAALAAGGGLACFAVAAPIYAWGSHMNELQADSEIHFLAPDAAVTVALALAVSGALLVLLALLALVLSLR